jgi:hypothetical protein
VLEGKGLEKVVPRAPARVVVPAAGADKNVLVVRDDVIGVMVDADDAVDVMGVITDGCDDGGAVKEAERLLKL